MVPLAGSGLYILLDVDSIAASDQKALGHAPSTFYISKESPRLAASGCLPLTTTAETVWAAQVTDLKNKTAAPLAESSVLLASSGGFPLMTNVVSVGGWSASTSRKQSVVPLAAKDGYSMAASGGLPLMLDGTTRQVMRTHITREKDEAGNVQPWKEGGVVLGGSAGLLFLFKAKENSDLKTGMTKYRRLQDAKVCAIMS